MHRLRSLVQAGLVLIGIGLLAGLSIGTIVSAPPYAVVFVDDATKTIFAPQCASEWQSRTPDGFGLLRRTTLGEASSQSYRLDYKCREAGAFSEDGPSLTGLILIKLGVLRESQYWWDNPYRTEDGIVHPGQPPVKSGSKAN